MNKIYNRGAESHVSYLDEYLIKHKEIERDNDLKEYCLDRLLDMCVKAGVDVARFDTKPGPDGDIVAVTIQRYFSEPQTICVEGDAPITMLKELIIKGKLG